jgi:hypothetical protein
MRTDNQNEQQNNENPVSTFSDAVNRSMVGDLGAITRGGCLTKTVTVVIVIVGLLILSKCTS